MHVISYLHLVLIDFYLSFKMLVLQGNIYLAFFSLYCIILNEMNEKYFNFSVNKNNRCSQLRSK